MTALCHHSNRIIKYARGHRVTCDCGRRVLVIGHRIAQHHVPAKKNENAR